MAKGKRKAKSGRGVGISRLDILSLAIKAQVDPRTIQKVLRGEAVRGMAGERAREVVESEQSRKGKVR